MIRDMGGMNGYNMKPDWAFEPGHIARVGDWDVTVVDENHNELIVPAGSLFLTCGAGEFLLMEENILFKVDELDAAIMEMDAELLSSGPAS